MGFDKNKYLAEMREMVSMSIEKWNTLSSAKVIYAISIWTDIAARFSSLNIETKQNSDICVASINAFFKLNHEQDVADGDLEMAELFNKTFTRNTNPADFHFRNFSTIRHRSIGKYFHSKSKAWTLIHPLLITIQSEVKLSFARFPHEADAEIAINSDKEWYDFPIQID